MFKRYNVLKVLSIVKVKGDTSGRSFQIKSKEDCKCIEHYWGQSFSGYALDVKSLFLAGRVFIKNGFKNDFSIYSFKKRKKSSEYFQLLAKSSDGSRDDIFYYKTKTGYLRIKYVHQFQNILDEHGIHRKIANSLSYQWYNEVMEYLRKEYHKEIQLSDPLSPFSIENRLFDIS